MPVKSTPGVTEAPELAVRIFTWTGSTSPHPTQLEGCGMPRVGDCARVVVIAVTMLVVVTDDEVGIDDVVLDANRLVVESVVLAVVVVELHAARATPSATTGTRTFQVRLGFTPPVSHVP
jgi:hypothetical protein